MKPSRFASALVLVLAACAALWFFWPRSSAPPALIEGLSDDGLRGAPCPARSLYEQDARRKQGVRPPAQLGERLRGKFPLGADASALATELAAENFERFVPCPNDESVFGARWLSPNWGHGDAYVYWRTDDNNRLIFLDGHVSRTN
ncbi:hypothetical protein [Rhodoblastus sp.]|uniref:hypothetical protein n=1 Tax=Rhodoblastus sp. TaxID=1962975 RepID=UPI003F94E0CE